MQERGTQQPPTRSQKTVQNFWYSVAVRITYGCQNTNIGPIWSDLIMVSVNAHPHIVDFSKYNLYVRQLQPLIDTLRLNLLSDLFSKSSKTTTSLLCLEHIFLIELGSFAFS